MKPSFDSSHPSFVKDWPTFEPPPSPQQQRAIISLTVTGLIILILWLTISQKSLVDFFYPPGQRIRFSLDINNAPPSELSLLPGIGPAMAMRIIKTRKQRGPFKSIDDIIHVPGIGGITLEGMRPFIRPITERETEK